MKNNSFLLYEILKEDASFLKFTMRSASRQF